MSVDPKKFRKLQEENLKLKAQLEAYRMGSHTRGAFMSWLGLHLANIVAGRKLMSSLARLYDELPGQVTKATMAEVSTHLIWRLTRVGIFAILVAVTPLLIMGFQTYILTLQNDKLDFQNELIGNQNRRLDQQIHLDEANRRSSFVFLMGNILDQMDEELKRSPSRMLSDEMIGRIVSLTQALRPYRYLENDELTPRQLSPERGQLLFALTNSFLNVRTYDEIFKRANFSYSDLRDANFSEAYLRNANLEHSYFSEADLSRADLAGANLSGVFLENSTIEQAYMPHVKLRNARLRQSKLINVVMTNADLLGADLREIYLSGDFSGSCLEGVNIQNAEIDSVTMDDVYWRSPDWAAQLDGDNLTGFYYIEDNYRIEQVVQENTVNKRDTLYVLRPRAGDAFREMTQCERKVVEILYSSPYIRQMDREYKERGYEIIIQSIANPFGSPDRGIRKDSIYAFRLVTSLSEDAPTLLQIRFDPRSGDLLELSAERSGDPARLVYDQVLWENLDRDCLFRRED